MKKDDFIDVMGEIDDKFYKEAEEYLSLVDFADGEIVAPVTVVPKRKSPIQTILPIAASVALVGVLGTAIYFGNKLNTADPNTEITTEITTDKIQETTNQREEMYIEYCKNYVYEQSKDVFSREEDSLQARILDLNFDGNNEIMVTTNELFCPIFVFEEPKENADDDPAFLNMISETLYNKHAGFLKELYPYENGEEKYYYCFFRSNNNAADTRAAVAVKYDEEKGYYLEGIMSYGTISYEGVDMPDATFFRNYVNISNITSTGEDGITEEEFRRLWGQHDKLPPISLDDENISDLNEYVNINNVTLPDVNYSSDSFINNKVKFTTIGEKWRLITLVGENARTDKAADPDIIYCDKLSLILSKDGNVLSVENIELPYGESEGRLALKKGTWMSDDVFSEIRIGNKYFYVFKYYLINSDFNYSQPQEVAFFAVGGNDKIYQLKGDLSQSTMYSQGSKSVIMAKDFVYGRDTALRNPYSIADPEGKIEYEFDIEALKNPEKAGFSFTARPFDMTEEELVSKEPKIYGQTEIPNVPGAYPDYEGRTNYTFDYNEREEFLARCLDTMIFETHTMGDYTIKLIGEHVRTDKENFPGAIFGKFSVIAEKNGVQLDGAAGFTVTVPGSIGDIRDTLDNTRYSEFRVEADRIGSYLEVYDLDCPVIALKYYLNGDIPKAVEFAFIMEDIYGLDDEWLYNTSFGICEKGTGIKLRMDASEAGGINTILGLNERDGDECLLIPFGSDRFAVVGSNQLVDEEAGIKYTFKFDEEPQIYPFTVQRIN